MTNGVTFIVNGVKKHSSELNLILQSHTITPATAKTKEIEIAGLDGTIDVSTLLTNGIIKYNNRNVSMTFLILSNIECWDNIQTKVNNFLNGQMAKIIFDNVPDFYIEGRLSVSSLSCSELYATFEVTGNCQPYKLSVQESNEDWLWDTFNFDTGIIYDNLNQISVVTDKLNTIYFETMRKPVTPTVIISSGTVSIIIDDARFDLEEGTHILDTILCQGQHCLKLITSDTDVKVTFKFRNGVL